MFIKIGRNVKNYTPCLNNDAFPVIAQLELLTINNPTPVDDSNNLFHICAN